MSGNKSAPMIRLMNGYHDWDNVKSMTVERAVILLKESRDTEPTSWLEYYEGDKTVVRAFFDMEEEVPIKEALGDMDLETKIESCKSDISLAFQAVGYEGVDIALATATRTIVKEGKQFQKFSLRAYLPGHLITVADNRCLASFLRDTLGNTLVDLAVYPTKRRVLRCVYCPKPDDPVLMKPITTHPIESFFITNVNKSDPVVAVSPEFRKTIGKLQYTNSDGDTGIHMSVEEGEKLFKMIRCTGYADWIKPMIYAKAAMGEAGFDVVLDWSRTMPRFKSSADCEKVWAGITPTHCGNGIGALHNCAKSCSPDAYAEFMRGKRTAAAQYFEDCVIEDEDMDGIRVNDAHAAQTFIHCVGKNKMKLVRGQIYVFDESVGMWDTDDSLLRRLIHKHRLSLTFQVGKKVRDYAGMDTGVRKIINMLPAYLDKDKDFWDNNIDSSHQKLLFTNGILDMTTMKFSPHFDPKIVFADRIDRPYNPKADPTVKAKIWKMLFQDPFTQEQLSQGVHLYQQKALGRTLSGDYRSRVCYFNIGETSTGKGLMCEAVRKSTGTYFGTFNIKSMIIQNNSGADAAKQFSWMADIRHKRGVFSNEPPSNAPLDGSIFKLSVSGGDEITIRQNRENEYVIRMRCTIWIMANDMPSIKPMDDAVEDRINGVVGYDIRFKNVVSGLNPDKEKLKDKNAKDFFASIEAQDALLEIINEGYLLYLKEGHECCADVLKRTKFWVGDSNDLTLVMEGKYAITGNKDDFVTFPELKEFFDKKGLGYSPKKLGMELGRITGLFKDDKKVNGYTQRVYRGIVAIKPQSQGYRFDF